MFQGVVDPQGKIDCESQRRQNVNEEATLWRKIAGHALPGSTFLADGLLAARLSTVVGRLYST